MITPAISAKLPTDFCAALREVIPANRIVTEADFLRRYEAATFPVRARVLAVLSLETVAEVQTVMRLATRHNVPTHAYSTGLNWGLGSRTPRQDAVLIDLSALRQIRAFDAQHGCLTVEPGVTFRQAYEFLCRQHSRFWLATVGGTDLASVLANALERGDGFGPLADRAPNTAGYEVVLPNGELLNTGFSRFAGARTAALAKEGVGPSFDGLFCQSDLGIVTALTVWLAQVPRTTQMGTFSVTGTKALAALVEALTEASRHGLIAPGAWTIWNLYKYLALQGQYPWQQTGELTPLDQRFIGSAGQAPTAPWFCSLLLTGHDLELLSAYRERMQRMIAGRIASAPAIAISWAKPLVADEITEWPLAKPSTANLQTVYWRKRRSMPSEPDPHRDGCGIIWICVKAPSDGSVAPVLEEMQALALAHGFELHTGFSAVSPRALNIYCCLIYDRDIPGEDERSMTCHDALIETAARHGLPLYRPSRRSASMLPATTGAHSAVERAVRAALRAEF